MAAAVFDEDGRDDGGSYISEGHASGIDVYFNVEDRARDFEAWLVSGTAAVDKDSGKDFRDLLQWARATTSHHSVHFGFAVPPTVPFVVLFDPRVCIFAIVFSNILCVDIDEKDGVSKADAARLIEQTAKEKRLMFRLYETDAGMHGYCTSQTFHHTKEATWTLMKEMSCDEMYVAFAAFRGFASRISPKAMQSAESWERREAKSKSDFDSEFVKKPWLDSPVVGSGREDPALAAMVDLNCQLNHFLRQMPDLHSRVNSNLEVDDLLRAATNEAMRLFDKAKWQHSQEMSAWLNQVGTFDVPYINNVAEWTYSHRNPINEITKHPRDGKPITVFKFTRGECKGKWGFVHKGEYSKKTFDSKTEAKKAVVAEFGCLEPPNVQPKVPRQPTAPLPSGPTTQASPQRVEATCGSSPPEVSRVEATCGSTPLEVSRWIAEMFVGTPYAELYASKFLEIGVDLDMLLNDLTNEFLVQDFEMTKGIHRSKILRHRDALAVARRGQTRSSRLNSFMGLVFARIFAWPWGCLKEAQRFERIVARSCGRRYAGENGENASVEKEQSIQDNVFSDGDFCGASTTARPRRRIVWASQIAEYRHIPHRTDR
eukprot:TRINITY_DN4207_c0_g1_i1.p1 TRINITY_DN4207_c0_g1~~TRINITY_DN4207_c0_g1_i1.p1  ORF type:complete len:599 (-),score=79.65 TRINITY_DN4207_c0_g1_i1:20-1816(-)